MNLEILWTVDKKLLNYKGVKTPHIDSPLDFADFYLYHCPKCDIELYHCSLYYFSLGEDCPQHKASWLLLTLLVILK